MAEKREKRKVVVNYDKCICHASHEAQIKQNREEIDELKGCHIREQETFHEDQRRIWEAIDRRITNKLFIAFVLIVVGGLGFVYDGIHNVDKNLSATTKEIKGEFKLVNEKIKTVNANISKLENAVQDNKKQLQKHMIQTNNQGR